MNSGEALDLVDYMEAQMVEDMVVEDMVVDGEQMQEEIVEWPSLVV